MAYLAFGCRLLVGLVFAVAAVGKLRDVAGLESSVRQLAPLLDMLPRALSRLAGRVAAWLVAGLELLVAVLLVYPPMVVWGFGLGLGLAAAFTVAIVLAMRRGTEATCRCFGATPRRLGASQVLRDVVLAAVALLGLVAALVAGPGGGVAGRLVAALAGGAGALLVIFFDDIVELFTSGPVDRPSLNKEAPWQFSRQR
jgi:hypothetical protein